ncbi:hypothetical protein IMZ08_19560 [Bacillus luteolus]|uniref:YppF-like protein n=1 Tax=Litchfieldia luteola TaxID=682179 RepID=A0ABR9QP11_9BACI|nr:YppF family protein [Cytobacillus luteolus]MBE4910238.1 hypothetical protein [Cytobacillus luteolus]MBP1942192.1 hypothetical protein [Cytobacillus luteolus]
MILNELKEKFIQLKMYEPVDNNELLDLAKQLYIKNQITIIDYRNFVRELEMNGALNPENTDELIEL